MCIWILPLVSFDLNGFSFLYSIFHKSSGKLLVMLPVSSRCPFGPSLVPGHCCGGWAGGLEGGPGAVPLPGHKPSRTGVTESAAGHVLLPCYVLYLCCIVPQHCLSYFWDVFLIPGRKCQSPCSQHSPCAVRRAQEHWVLMQHPRVSGTRGWLWQWTLSLALWALTFHGHTGVPCSLHIAAIPGSLPGMCCLPVGRDQKGKQPFCNHFLNQKLTDGGGEYAEWAPLRVCPHPPARGDIHNMHQWFTQGIRRKHSLVQQEAAGQERGDGLSGMGWEVTVSLANGHCSVQEEAVEGELQCYSEWE